MNSNNKNQDQLYKDQKFLDKHADELDELLREASAAVNDTSKSFLKRKEEEEAKKTSTQQQQQQQKDNQSTPFSPKIPEPPRKSPLVAFSTYSNVATSSSVASFSASSDLQLQNSNNDFASSSSPQLMKSSQELRTIRLKPIDEGIGGSTKILKKAQKEELQWYRQNVLLPQQQVQEEQKMKQQQELKLQAKQEMEEQKRLENMRPVDPSRYWMLHGTRGSLVPDSRTLHAVAAFEDRLYVFGGEVQLSSPSSSSATSSHSSAILNNINTSASSFAPTTVVSDDFFVASGLANTHGIQWAPVEVLTSANTKSSSTIPQKPLPRCQHTMVVVPQRSDCDAALFLFGGVGPNGKNHLLGDTWLFWIEAKKWQFVPSLPPTPSTKNSNNGSTNSKSVTKQLESGGVPSPRCGHSCAVLKKRYAFIFGGRILKKSDPTMTKVSNELFVFDASLAATIDNQFSSSSNSLSIENFQNCWLKMPGAPSTNSKKQQEQEDEKDDDNNNNNASDTSVSSWPCSRYHHAAASSDENTQERMFIHGGIDAAGRTLTDLWFLDYSTRIWRQVEGLSYEAIGAVPRSRHGLVALSMNQVMMFGGVSIIDAHAGRRIGHNSNSDQLFTASPGVVVNVCSEKIISSSSSSTTRYIVETVRSIPFVGKSSEIPDISFQSFGGCAVSNGTAFVFSGASSSSSSAFSKNGNIGGSISDKNINAVSGGVNQSSNNNGKGTVGRFALPLPRDIPLYESRSLFSIWASRRLNKDTTPIPHDIEFAFPNSSSSNNNNSNRGSSSSVYCHKSILQIRAPELLRSIHTQCSFETKNLGRVGTFAQTKYEIVPRRRDKGLLEAPAGFCENKDDCVNELIRFLYCGVFSESESRKIAQESNDNSNLQSSSSFYYSVARKYDIPALSQYLNVLRTGNREGNNNTGASTSSPPNIATKRALAENFGLSSVVDDNFAAISGYTCPGDVTLVVEDPFVAAKNGQLAVETVQVHASIVACASSFLKNLLRSGAESATDKPQQGSVNNDSIKLEIVSPTMKRITGLRLPTGSALAAVIEHMYSGRGGSYSSDANSTSNNSSTSNSTATSSTNNRLVHIGNAFEVSFIASKLDLPFLRATAERVVLDSLLPPVLEHPMSGLCSNLALAARYNCGRVYEVVVTAISMRVHEMDPDLFIGEVPLEAQAEILENARECFPEGSREIENLQKAFDLKSRKKWESLMKEKKGQPTVAKNAAIYEERANAANLRV